MKKKVVLILSMTGGFGHIRAGEALLDYAKENLPHIAVEHINIADVSFSLKKYSAFYDYLSKKVPIFWEMIYNYLPVSVARRMVGLLGILSPALRKHIQDKKPDVVIFTNVIIVPIFSFLYNGKFPHIKTAVVVTDFHAHPYYNFSEIDYYFVAHQKVKEDLEKNGIDEKKIIVTGIPVNPKFYIKQFPEDLKKKYGIKNNLPVVLLIASFAIPEKKLDFLIKKLLEQKVNIVFIASGNDKFYKIGKINSSERLISVNWTNVMEEYIKIADVVITKAGGLTVSECLTLSKPMIIVNPIAGQEEHNAEFIEKNNFGKRSRDFDDIFKILPEFISKRIKKEGSFPQTNPSEKIFKYFS